MATDCVIGIDGTAVFNSVTVPITEWALDITTETKDTTDSGDVTSSEAWATYLESGIKRWSGTFAGFIEDGTAGIVPGSDSLCTLTLTAETGFTFAGSAIITNRSISLSVVEGDATKHTYTFQGSGTLTETNS